MELIIGLGVLVLVGYVLFFRNKEEHKVSVEEAPYKVENPETVQPQVGHDMGGSYVAPVAEVAPAPVAEVAPVVVAPVVVAEVAPVVVAEVAPAKKPRKPRVVKAVVAPVKAVAKKAAPKKAAAIKAKPTKSKKT